MKTIRNDDIRELTAEQLDGVAGGYGEPGNPYPGFPNTPPPKPDYNRWTRGPFGLITVTHWGAQGWSLFVRPTVIH